MRVTSISFLLLLIAFFCSAEEVLEAVPGVFSIKTVSNGLSLPVSTTFMPIEKLTATVHIQSACAVFVHYQMTFYTENQDFYSMLQINDANAGSLVHSRNQYYKTATGFYMVNLNPGLYTIGVLYKSPVAISMPDYDWQAVILQVVWAEDAEVASDSIKCFPMSTTTDAYNIWGPLKGVETALYLPSNRAILSAYQFSVEMVSTSHLVTALEVDGFYQQTTSFIKGNAAFLDLHGGWAGNACAGVHYFSIQYRTPTSLSFTDCTENNNLYAMMLPPSCNAVTVNPESSLTLNDSNKWAPTDLIYSFTLSKQSYAIIIYQYAGDSGGSHIIMRLNIDSVSQKHTSSLTGNTAYAG